MYNLYIFESASHSIELVRSLFLDFQKDEGAMKNVVIKEVSKDFYEFIPSIKVNSSRINIYH